MHQLIAKIVTGFASGRGNFLAPGISGGYGIAVGTQAPRLSRHTACPICVPHTDLLCPSLPCDAKATLLSGKSLSSLSCLFTVPAALALQAAAALGGLGRTLLGRRSKKEPCPAAAGLSCCSPSSYPASEPGGQAVLSLGAATLVLGLPLSCTDTRQLPLHPLTPALSQPTSFINVLIRVSAPRPWEGGFGFSVLMELLSQQTPRHMYCLCTEPGRPPQGFSRAGPVSPALSCAPQGTGAAPGSTLCPRPPCPQGNGAGPDCNPPSRTDTALLPSLLDHG